MTWRAMALPDCTPTMDDDLRIPRGGWHWTWAIEGGGEAWRRWQMPSHTRVWRLP